MENEKDARLAARNVKTVWVKYLLIVLIAEKIIQHTIVTIAFYFNWAGIRSTVAVNPSILMFLGAAVAILFMLSFWGMLTRQKRMTKLVIALALFDIIGEFAAQGKAGITITMSFLVAAILLILTSLYRQQELKEKI